jgi:acyl-CoA synthetase (AMP-forming)/AMP-acid ligase II
METSISSSKKVPQQSLTMDGSALRPRDDPRRTQDLVPHIVDYLASTQPDGLLAEYPVSAVSYDEGYRKITYGQFANSVNGLAHWMKRTLGTPRKEHEIVAYMGPNDLRYPALVVAAVKVGFVVRLFE